MARLRWDWDQHAHLQSMYDGIKCSFCTGTVFAAPWEPHHKEGIVHCWYSALHKTGLAQSTHIVKRYLERRPFHGDTKPTSGTRGPHTRVNHNTSQRSYVVQTSFHLCKESRTCLRNPNQLFLRNTPALPWPTDSKVSASIVWNLLHHVSAHCVNKAHRPSHEVTHPTC